MSSYFEAYKGSEPYAFVSYSHIDSEMVYPVIKELNDEGYRIWYDEGIAPSAEWRGVINEHIRDCSVFIIFVTRNSMDSHEVIKECTYAINLHKKLHIIYLENVPDNMISPNLIADFTNSQRVHAYEMHSDVFAKRLRAPLAKCKTEEEPERADLNEEKSQKKISTSFVEDGQSVLLRTWKAANPSFIMATMRMSLLLVVTLVISYIILFVNMEASASGGMTVLINVICLLCLIPLIFWMRKTKYGKNAVLSNDKLQSGFVSETVYTSVCRVLITLWAMLFYTLSATAFGSVDSWISGIWPIFVLTFITEIGALLFSVVSRCMVNSMLGGKKKVRKTPLKCHNIFQVMEIINIAKAGLVLLCSCLIYAAKPYNNMFLMYDYNMIRITDIWGDAQLLICISAFTIAARIIMLFHERAFFGLGKKLINEK